MTELIRIRSLAGYREVVLQLGGKPDVLLSRFGINPLQLDSDALIPYVSRTLLLEATAETLSCPDFGLRLAERLNLKTIGPLALLAQNSTTVGAAIEAVGRYLTYHCTAVRIGIDADLLPKYKCLTFSANAPGCPHQRHSVESSVSYMQSVLKMISGGKVKPEQILFRHDAIMPMRQYSQRLGCPVRFLQDKNALVLLPSVMELPIDQANPDMLRFAEAYIGSIVEKQAENVTGQVRALVTDLLPKQQCTVKYVADRLCMHHRTLQRRLAGEGITFDEIVDAARCKRAQEFLAQRNLTMAQIAALLGFSEQSSFNHACLRWFGCTPREVRQKPPR